MISFSKKIASIFILFIASTFSSQEIDEIRYQNIVNQLKLKKVNIKENLIVEKKMPNKEDSYIIVIPVLEGVEEDDGFTVRNTILITDGAGKIKNQYADPEEYFSDAVMLQSFTVDTGLYNLNSNVRAFGIVANYKSQSQPNPYSADEISLYFTQGNTLKNILNQYQIYRSGGEWDMKCAGEFNYANSVIMIAKEKTNGFANLKVKTSKTLTVGKIVNDECTESETSKTSYKVLKFNKSHY